jgi:rhomboid family GlyGly-CTERM serine protease
VVIPVLLQTFGSFEGLRLETAAPGTEIWRLATGQLVHVSWTHLLLNILGLSLVWLLVGDAFGGLGWILVTLVCLAAVNVGLIIYSPDVAWYAGLSGLLHGLIVAGALANWNRSRYVSVALLVFVVSKLIFEHYKIGLVAAEQLIGASVISDAHVYGAVGGVLAGIAALVGGSWVSPIRD